MPSMLSPETPQPRPDFTTDSPNYFGLVVDNSTSDTLQDDAFPFKTSAWSPPSSKTRSVAAYSPQRVPLDKNPALEDFKRQANLNSLDLTSPSVNKTQTKPPLPRHRSYSPPNLCSVFQIPPLPGESVQPKPGKPASPPMKKPDISALLDPSSGSRSPKRLHSQDEDGMFSDRPRRESPAAFHDDERPGSNAQGSPPQRVYGDKHPRLSLPHEKGWNIPPGIGHQRAETLPDKMLDSNPDEPDMVTPQHIVNLIDSAGEELLVLDIRVSTQHVRSRISNALNLCVPTTLLKRPSHNIKKLAETFKDDAQRSKFQKWPTCKAIVVYDQSSSQMKEAGVCLNILKKFSSEGWRGPSYIIQGGFVQFASLFPDHIDKRASAPAPTSSTNLSLRPSTPSVAPVIGGCPIPATKNAANPFFGNIRQNMDLIGGVGQMSIHKPDLYDAETEQEIPAWLRVAADERNNGKTVADRFLQIERREQKRMQDALSGNVTYGASSQDDAQKIQIAGIEKGAKNRYNNIWPYEHSRVKLENVPDEGCDYVNANYVATSVSPRRYVATQGPIPATFNDFWNMVWQQDVRVIVMLTAEMEGGQVKAHNYWSQKRYGALKLSFLKESKASLDPARIQRRRNSPGNAAARKRSSTASNIPSNATPDVTDMSPTDRDQPYVIVRRFTLTNDEHPFERMREVTQLQYSSWPDFGVPTHPAHLLGLVEQCDAVVRTSSGLSPSSASTTPQRPVLVHCSAGCGRTGTFCTVDTVVDVLKRVRKNQGHARKQSAGLTKAPEVVNDGNRELDPFFGTPSASNGIRSDDVEKDQDIDLIEKVVEEFRLQRLSMVQSLRQYVLCYETVLEWLAREVQPRTA